MLWAEPTPSNGFSPQTARSCSARSLRPVVALPPRSYRVSSQLPVKSFTEANMSIRPATPTTAVAMLRTRAPRVATPTSTRAPPAITRLYTPPRENVRKAAQVSHRPSPTSTARKRGPRRW